MFEHFTFGAAHSSQSSYYQHDQREEDIQASPTDTSFPHHPESYPFPNSRSNNSNAKSPIDDIVHRLAEQSLARDDLVGRFAAWSKGGCCSSSSYESQDYIQLQHGYIAQNQIAQEGGAGGGTLAQRRRQRQLNTQMQVSASHMRDIAALVEQMVVSRSQCRLRLRQKTASGLVGDGAGFDPREFDREMEIDSRMEFERSTMVGLVVDVDEGFHDGEEGLVVDEIVGRENREEAQGGMEGEGQEVGIGGEREEQEDEQEATLRRTSTPSGIRKWNAVRWQRSTDVALVGGRLKVRSKPRMRRRRNAVVCVPE